MKKTILVADHAQAYLKHIANILRRMGFDVFPMDKSFDILTCLKEKHADLIMIDEDISKGHIPEILDWLKQNENTKGIPVVLMSSHPHNDMKAVCKAHGCTEYLAKPTNLEMLHKILQDNIYGPLGYVRRHMRVNYQNKISILYKDESYNYMLESLSEGGVYIATESPLPVDAEVEVFLELENNFVLDLKGRVIYINEFKPKESHIPMGMAVQFLEGNDDKMHVITDFVKGLLISPG
jgi:two-component system cell cycle response regulator DivK